MSREPKVIKELIEKIENPTETAKSAIDTLIRDVRKLDKNEKIPPETMEKIQKVSDDANKILGDLAELEKQRRVWRKRYDLAQKLIKGYKRIAEAQQIQSSLNPISMAISIGQVALIAAQSAIKGNTRDILNALKNIPRQSKRMLGRGIQSLKDLLDEKARGEARYRRGMRERGYTDDEIDAINKDLPQEFDDLEVMSDEDLLAELEGDDF
mgnify:CR=1 FL=1|tara:strand:+ start:2720 stop:3352 length:633 start_codon:yes stop_codon:yes gene_type:complete